MKRAAATALLIGLAAAGCAGGRPTAERHLVFVRLTAPQNAVVWIADEDGRHAHRLTRGTSGLISPDGRTVAVGRIDGIHLVSSDGKHDRLLTSKLLNPLAWSPDGKRLIAARDEPLSRMNRVAIVDRDSGRSRVLARGGLYGLGFSSDGRRLVYARASRESIEGICGPRINLYLADLASGRSTALTHDGRSAFPVWGPRRIAFLRMPRRLHFYDCFSAGIWTLRPNGADLRAIVARAPRALSRAGYYGLQPVAWLRAHDMVVGVRTEWGNEAAVLNTTTRRLRRLGLYVDKPSRDGRLLLGSGGNEKVTISIIRVSDRRRLFVLRGDICCPDWNR